MPDDIAGGKRKVNNDRPRMMGLDDLKASEGDESNYYAGGEKSGMAIEGAGRPEHDLARQIIQKAQQSLPTGNEDEYNQEASRKPQFFTGRGHKISDEASTSTHSEPEPSAQVASEGVAVRTLTFWSDGFTLTDEGPLYEYSDPENQKLLAMMQSGEAPIKLLNVRPNQQVDLRVAHQMGEQFVPSKPKMAAFSGRGQRLGDSAELPVAAKPSESTKAAHQPSQPEIDSTKPTTNLQLRLANGSRINATFNIDTTIAQVYAYVTRQVVNDEAIKLLAGRPPVDLIAGDHRTLQEANLLNSVIMQQKL